MSEKRRGVKLYCSVDLRASPSTSILLNVLVVTGTMDVYSESCGSFSVGTMLIIVREPTRTSISALKARHPCLFLSINISFQSDWSSLIVPQVVGTIINSILEFKRLLLSDQKLFQ